MKYLFQTSAVIFLFFASLSITQACTCNIIPLSKRFREARAVFIGEIPNGGDMIADSQVQGIKDGIILEVVKSWKGVNKKYVSVGFNISEDFGYCPTLYGFDKDKKYLVFAYGKELKVETACSDTRKLITDKENDDYENQQKDIKRLNSFWFRFWARLKPF